MTHGSTHTPAPTPSVLLCLLCVGLTYRGIIWLYTIEQKTKKRIAFFELYRRWKSFTVWKKTVRAFKFTQASSALRTGLFAFVPPLRLALAEIRRECVDVERRRLFAVGQGETITLEALLERQRTTQQEVAQVSFAAC